ncbi:hypothetical protein HM1_2637 [Heliomicrobium modesticaldum Ice1]|uniref:Uncharacterized protein n=1 Tax=Heliobacterium modesticaldum (strain ATCC 51547 / Ice1) TaxID=498761 RepID=B0TBF3_HELMI|nr:hypothetical protein [Heliomicrobium modesticaldum]ABZ85166.1 hypothetical protein HM1_2637 [Heliomicrobium modesticaldum Ice1]
MAFFERWLDPMLQRVIGGPVSKGFVDGFESVSEESSLEILRFLNRVCDTFSGFDVPSDVQRLLDDDPRDSDASVQAVTDL